MKIKTPDRQPLLLQELCCGIMLRVRGSSFGGWRLFGAVGKGPRAFSFEWPGEDAWRSTHPPVAREKIFQEAN